MSGAPNSPPLFDDRDEVPLLHEVALDHLELGDRAGVLRDDGDLHFHRLEDHQGVALFYLVTLRDDDLPDVRHHLRMDFRHRGSSPRVTGARPAIPSDRYTSGRTEAAIYQPRVISSPDEFRVVQ